MTRKTLFLIMAMFYAVGATAANAELFNYNKEQVANEFAQLQTLENYISANPNVSLADLQVNSSNLVSELNLIANNTSGFGLQDAEPPLGISSFIWGCCFGLVGVLIVYLVTDDNEETKKSFRGCIVGSLVGCVINVIYYFAWYGTSYYYY